MPVPVQPEIIKILIVDDDPDIAMMIRIILEYKGFAVSMARPTEAISDIRTNNYSVVIMDMLLSGVNGTDICREIKNDPLINATRVIMISAHPNAREICMEAGADDFIGKPFDMYDMLARIGQFTHKASGN